jgi:hypothetical protein
VVSVAVAEEVKVSVVVALASVVCVSLVVPLSDVVIVVVHVRESVAVLVNVIVDDDDAVDERVIVEVPERERVMVLLWDWVSDVVCVPETVMVMVEVISLVEDRVIVGDTLLVYDGVFDEETEGVEELLRSFVTDVVEDDDAEYVVEDEYESDDDSVAVAVFDVMVVAEGVDVRVSEIVCSVVGLKSVILTEFVAERDFDRDGEAVSVFASVTEADADTSFVRNPILIGS